jgi:hypothetical protein
MLQQRHRHNQADYSLWWVYDPLFVSIHAARAFLRIMLMMPPCTASAYVIGVTFLADRTNVLVLSLTAFQRRLLHSLRGLSAAPRLLQLLRLSKLLMSFSWTENNENAR